MPISSLPRPCVFLFAIIVVTTALLDRVWGEDPQPELITFRSDNLTLKGFLWKPAGDGPFPAILWNHGSEKRPGAVKTVAPYFVNEGYIFFVPHRRGQGRSPGPYIMDQLREVSGRERNKLVVELNEVHFKDQQAALAYLKSLPYVDQNRLVVMGASFGGIQTILAAEFGGGYRVAVACSAAAQSWKKSPDLRARLRDAAGKARMPIFFFRAENDYDLTPSRVLSEEVGKTGTKVESKTYPPFGSGEKGQEGHRFCWRGTDVWGPDALKFIEATLGRD